MWDDLTWPQAAVLITIVLMFGYCITRLPNEESKPRPATGVESIRP